MFRVYEVIRGEECGDGFGFADLDTASDFAREDSLSDPWCRVVTSDENPDKILARFKDGKVWF